MFNIARTTRTGILAVIVAAGLGACSVTGVSDYQRALKMGCTPSPTGVSCGSSSGG